MTIIVDLGRCQGNATINDIRTRQRLAFGGPGCSTQDQLQSKLNRMMADDLIVKDGTRQHGGHYALTIKGRHKLAHCRQQQARAA